ncbi:DUF2262 domain-containing protein [Maribacter aquivivus]|uniref:DUF2262 domain-containing protein n=1 Tax=Maribacter aquivivus TaxID=228958 RepID=UPI00249054F7|nr:DUF2262 domain-containing protein [Maribacter aquivivus]
MGIFSRLRKNQNYSLKKADFKTEKEEYQSEVTFISEDFKKSLAEWKKKEGIADIKNETGKIISIANHTDVDILRNKVRVQYDPTELEIDEGLFITKLNEKLDWISRNENEINSAITEKLLPLKNEDWIEENETIISKKEFVKRIKLTFILVFDDTSLELVYDDGDLFWKHQIVVDLNKENKITDVDISG